MIQRVFNQYGKALYVDLYLDNISLIELDVIIGGRIKNKHIDLWKLFQLNKPKGYCGVYNINKLWKISCWLNLLYTILRLELNPTFVFLSNIWKLNQPCLIRNNESSFKRYSLVLNTKTENAIIFSQPCAFCYNNFKGSPITFWLTGWCIQMGLCGKALGLLTKWPCKNKEREKGL